MQTSILSSTALVGREKEIAEIATRLADPHCRLLTLTGPGGVGKTRLALVLSTSQSASFMQGTHFVVLQPLEHAESVLGTVIDSIGLSLYGQGDAETQLLDYLHERELLLVLDNFEHVLDSVGLVQRILYHAPGVKILVTSRERLRLREEWVFDVHGLSYPGHDRLHPANSYSAVQLFTQSARRAGYTPSADADTPAIISICQLVEGMPLALELAAAWVRFMTCAEIAHEIEHSLDILTTTTRNMPEKHHSMRAVFDHSWRLLSDEEQAVLPRLSVFHGGFTREAAEHVAGATLVILASLVDKSLLRVNENSRYSLHELLRQYAAARLLDADEAATTARCHVVYFTALAEHAAQEFYRTDYHRSLNRLEAEHANLRAGLDWCQNYDPEQGLHLVMSLFDFWRTRGYALEGLERIEKFLSADQAISAQNPAMWANALTVAAWLAFVGGNNLSLGRWANEALRFSREIGDKQNISWALRSLGHCAVLRGDEGEAERLWTEGLALSREIEDYQIVCTLLNNLGILMRNGGNYSRAIVYHSEAVQLLDQIGDVNYVRIRILWEMGISWLFKSDYKQARQLFTDVLALSQEPIDFAYCLEGFGGLAAAQNRPERAAQLMGAAETVREKARTPRVKIDRYHEQFVAKTREQLNGATFAAAWAAGQTMTTEESIAYALHSDESEVEQPANPLTPRELEILRLIADGCSTHEVTQHLFLSVGTVRWYLNQIYSKLSVHSRIQAIARARDLKLLA